jgi:hypothetical protein
LDHGVVVSQVEFQQWVEVIARYRKPAFDRTGNGAPSQAAKSRRKRFRRANSSVLIVSDHFQDRSNPLAERGKGACQLRTDNLLKR